jgi:hypothetical protein
MVLRAMSPPVVILLTVDHAATFGVCQSLQGTASNLTPLLINKTPLH